jgi:DnaJ-class molecular chaperone
MQRFIKQEEYEEWKIDRLRFAEETQGEPATKSETGEIDQSHQVLKLKLEATVNQIKHAYESLINLWDPGEFQKYPYLEQRAYEKVKQVELAYEKLVKEWLKKKR